MQQKKSIYLLFIILVSLFIGLRIYSSTQNPTSVSKVESEAITPAPTQVPVLQSEYNEIDDEDFFPDSELLLPEDEDSTGILNDPWHGDFTQVTPFSGDIPRIVCFGDSLTQSTDQKISYPDFLSQLTDCEVINYGLTSENTSMIAMREGGIPILLNATVIPDECELIPIFMTSESGHPIYFLEYGDGGVNPCSIDGIEGNLSKLNGSYYFKRLEKGKQTVIDEGTQLNTFAMNDKKEDDVLVIFAGTNDLPNKDSIYQIIEIEHDMIKSYGTDKYLIIGLTYDEKIKDIEAINEILANEFEDHFLDIRTYLINYGLEDAGLTPTKEDKSSISRNKMPPSLLSDNIHGNKYFYELLANQVYRRLQYLGYLPVIEN